MPTKQAKANRCSRASRPSPRLRELAVASRWSALRLTPHAVFTLAPAALLSRLSVLQRPALGACPRLTIHAHTQTFLHAYPHCNPRLVGPRVSLGSCRRDRGNGSRGRFVSGLGAIYATGELAPVSGEYKIVGHEVPAKARCVSRRTGATVEVLLSRVYRWPAGDRARAYALG